MGGEEPSTNEELTMNTMNAIHDPAADAKMSAQARKLATLAKQAAKQATLADENDEGSIELHKAASSLFKQAADLFDLAGDLSIATEYHTSAADHAEMADR